MSDQTGPRNSNWRGGRVVDPRGFVLIRVGTDHPLADVRGYAYEHRLVAQAKVGRQLRPGEEAYPINGVRGDNSPENIALAPDRKHRGVARRKPGSNRRLPGEENPRIECACGCGVRFPKFDRWDRPRRYVSGHNPR